MYWIRFWKWAVKGCQLILDFLKLKTHCSNCRLIYKELMQNVTGRGWCKWPLNRGWTKIKCWIDTRYSKWILNWGWILKRGWCKLILSSGWNNWFRITADIHKFWTEAKENEVWVESEINEFWLKVNANLVPKCFE